MGAPVAQSAQESADEEAEKTEQGHIRWKGAEETANRAVPGAATGAVRSCSPSITFRLLSSFTPRSAHAT